MSKKEDSMMTGILIGLCCTGGASISFGNLFLIALGAIVLSIGIVIWEVTRQ